MVPDEDRVTSRQPRRPVDSAGREGDGIVPTGHEVTIRATVTIPDDDERTGSDGVIVVLEGSHSVPVRLLHVDKVQTTGRSD